MMDQDNITWTGARAPGVERLSRSHGGIVGHRSYLDSERGRMALTTTRRSEANHGGLLIDPSYLGQAPTDSRPWSRTGENPPYGILGGTMETSASFEARLAPSSYPTLDHLHPPWRRVILLASSLSACWGGSRRCRRRRDSPERW